MIFISYSHKDKDFVDKVAMSLAHNRIPVWLDRWELRVGDSLLGRVQQAITDAGLLLVVLSKSSVRSSWCKKEINAGLLRELEKRRVSILPILKEDCNIPLFLRDKLYADFRTDFKTGMNNLLDAATSHTNAALGAVKSKGYNNDFGIDWGMLGSRFAVSIDVISYAGKLNYSVLTQLQIVGNDAATDKFKAYAKAGLDHLFMNVVIECCSPLSKAADLSVLIPDNRKQIRRLGLRDSRLGVEFDIIATCRRMGEDNGKSVLFHLANIFGQIRDTVVSRRPHLTPEQKKKLAKITGLPL